MEWILTQLPVGDEVRNLCADLSTSEPYPEPLANILVQRKITNLEQAKPFLRPELAALHDPFLMKDMDIAVSRIIDAVKAKQKILVYGDYDVDGTTSVALMTMFLNQWGIYPEYYVPDREKEGYGISFQGIDYAAKLGVDLIIALDCGTKAVGKVKYAADKGIEFIICDHHTPGDELPAAVALLNPKRSDCEYPFKELSACGVGFKLCCALEQAFRLDGFLANQDPGTSAEEEFVDIVTLSIACDIVPIVGENRTLANQGLKKLKANPLPGIKALIDMSEFERPWDIGDLVFFIGPRINAAGRLDHAIKAVDLLRGEDADLHKLAVGLERSNEDRKTYEQDITESALAMIEQRPNDTSTVLFNADWKKGVIGIVASRLIETHYRPTILLTKSNGHWVGSGRSVKGFDLYDALESCSEHVLQYGGHRYAVGLTIEENELESFRAAFEKVAKERLKPQELTQELQINHLLDFSEINPRFLRLLGLLGPFGPSNPEPVFVSKEVQVTDYKVLKDVHLRLNLEQKGKHFEAIAFKMAEKWENTAEDILDIAYQPAVKKWNRNEYIQLKIKDFRPSKADNS